MHEQLSSLIFVAGIGQLCVLIASALVPFRLNWKTEFQGLPRLHRQMYWIYGGFIVLSITAFGLISLFNAKELAGGTGLAQLLPVHRIVLGDSPAALGRARRSRTPDYVVVETWAITPLPGSSWDFTAVYGWAALSSSLSSSSPSMNRERNRLGGGENNSLAYRTSDAAFGQQDRRSSPNSPSAQRARNGASSSKEASNDSPLQLRHRSGHRLRRP